MPSSRPSTPGGRHGWPGLDRFDRRELAWLFVGFGACVFVLLFLLLAGEVTDGDTQAFDMRLLQALRSRDDSSRPIGPDWVEGVLLDITALGSPTVLGLVVAAVAGFLLLQVRYRTATVVVLTALSGELVSSALKYAFNRPRPTIVSHLRVVLSASFPSGHAMESAVVYLTLGAMLMRLADRRLTKLYCLVIAMLLTFLVGISRVFLGVHYPTDVIGGWIVGFAWASICWLVSERLEIRTAIDRERSKSA